MVSVAGLSPQQYWLNTLRQNRMISKRKDNEEENMLRMSRRLEFAIYKTTLTMEGKQVFRDLKRPEDLYRLPSENIKKKETSAVFDPEAAIAAYNTTIKDKDKWLTMRK